MPEKNTRVGFKEENVQKERIGFVGGYSHDVILLLAKVLTFVGKKVLLEDRNAVHTLAASIPVPEELSGEKTTVEYDGIYFTREEGRCDVAFDICLTDFGWTGGREEMAGCTRLILVTDMMRHHLKRLQKLSISFEGVRECIIRDAVGGTRFGEDEVKTFLAVFPKRTEIYLQPDVRDIRNRFVCESVGEYSLKRASPEMRETIVSIACELCPELTKKEIQHMVRRGERRQYP